MFTKFELNYKITIRLRSGRNEFAVSFASSSLSPFSIWLVWLVCDPRSCASCVIDDRGKGWVIVFERFSPERFYF